MAKRLEQALKDKNDGNQSEMARFVGVTPQAVQKWISGDTEPRGKNLKKASEFLGVPEATLKFGAEAVNHRQETDKSQGESPTNTQDSISASEIIKLIDLYRQSNKSGRRYILKAASAAIKFGASGADVANDQL